MKFSSAHLFRAQRQARGIAGQVQRDSLPDRHVNQPCFGRLAARLYLKTHPCLFSGEPKLVKTLEAARVRLTFTGKCEDK